LKKKQDEVLGMQKQCIHDKKIYKKWLKTMTTIEEKITRANKFSPFFV